MGRPPRYGAPAPHRAFCEDPPWRITSFPISTTIPGVPVIEIGAKEFMCVGATPPYDHPHVFLDMGEDNEIICPYCSTLYRHDPSLDPHAARPAECALPLTATA